MLRVRLIEVLWVTVLESEGEPLQLPLVVKVAVGGVRVADEE